MQTHEDRDFDMQGIQEKARGMVRSGLSQITAGKPGEGIIGQAQIEGILVTHRPDDEHGILRIGIGGLPDTDEMNYCVFRGDRHECIRLLARCVKSLRHFLGEGSVDPNN